MTQAPTNGTSPPDSARVSSPTRRPAQQAVREYLAFGLGEESYALPLSAVREILKPPPVTEVPRAPAHVLGIVSVRGRVTTVLDLRRRLRLPEAPTDRQTRVLMVDSGSEVLGLWVDRVLLVYRLSEEEIELAAGGGSESNDYVFGIGRPKAPTRAVRVEAQSSEDILILLDPGPLLRRS